MRRAKRQKKPKHTTEVRAYAFPLEVSARESARLHAVLDVCHALRNRLAAERRENRTAVREAREAGAKPPEFLTKKAQYQAIFML